MKNLEITITEDQMEQCVNIAKEAYRMPQPYNTDIYMVDGEIVKLDSMGSTYLQEYDLMLLSIAASDTREYQNSLQEGMTTEQIEYCQEKNWLAIYETNSVDPAEWEEFTVNDDGEFDSSIEDRINEKIEQHNEEIKMYV